MRICNLLMNQANKIITLILLLTKNDPLKYVSRDRESAHKYLLKIGGNQAKFACNLILDTPTPPRSIMEIGSNCGPNLFTVGNSNPEINLIGLDINSEACRIGREYAETKKIKCEFYQCDIQNHQQLGNIIMSKSPDSIFTFATLMLIPPKRITEIMTLLISSVDNLILIEQMNFGIASRLFRSGFPTFSQPYWSRDYMLIIEEIVKEMNVTAHYEMGVVPKDIWNPGNGYYLKVQLHKSEK